MGKKRFKSKASTRTRQSNKGKERIMREFTKSKPRMHRRFANRMIAALRQYGETRPIRYDAHKNELLIGEDQRNPAARYYLGNAFQDYAGARPGQEEAVLHRHASGVATYPSMEMAEQFEEARPFLLPRVKPRFIHALSLIDNDGPSHKMRLWHQPLGGHLALSLAYDLPRALACVPDNRLTTWGVTGEEAFAIACANLRRLSTKPFDSPTPGVFVSAWGDSSGASRIALTELIRDLKVKGSHVAIAPNRDTLIVTGSEDHAGLRVMLRLAERAIQKAYRVSGVTIRLHDCQWEPFEPDAFFPDLKGFRALRLKSLAEAYAAQKDGLDAIHKAKDEPIYTTPYLGFFKDGQVFSLAVWSETITNLLPRTDMIAFVARNPGPRKVAFADWDRVVEMVGDLMIPLDIYPPRFRVDRFPTGEQLKALGFAPGFEHLSKAGE
jgi:hypothetical protein